MSITRIPGFGITRIRFNGYNLSLIVRHPFEISGAKIELIIKKRKLKSIFLPEPAPQIPGRRSGAEKTQAAGIDVVWYACASAKKSSGTFEAPELSASRKNATSYFFHNCDISSKVLPLVSGTQRHTKRAESSDINA